MEYKSKSDNETLILLQSNNLGSTNLTIEDDESTVYVEMRYTPRGSVRYTSGSMPTDFAYTGQRSETESFGLMFYNARWYDPRIIQFNQPDNLIPDPFNELDLNRYAYARFNPLKYSDPTVHCTADPYDEYGDYECFQLARELSDLTGGSYETYAGYDYDQLVSMYNRFLEDPENAMLLILRDEALRLSDLMQDRQLSDVEALAQLLAFAAPLYGDDVNSFLEDLGIVVGGLDTTGLFPVELGADSPYYIGYQAFNPVDTGFIEELNPWNDNQVRHFLAGAAGGNNNVFAQVYLLIRETAPEDDALYVLSFVFSAFLHNRPPYLLIQPRLEEADDWVLVHLAK